MKRIYAGRSNEELTLNGRRQAEQAAKKLASINLHAIYSSPLRRAVQTAEIIASHHNKQPILEGSFTEQRLGIWEGLSEDEIARHFKEEWEVWNKRPTELFLEGRETLDELLERVLDGIDKVRTAHPQGPVVVVTHVAIIRVTYLHLHNVDINKYRTIPVLNGEIFLMRGL
jgi:broad specificity phosphatase PhoE